MAEAEGAVVRSWADGPLDRDVEAAVERLARSNDVRRIAVMPDVHLAADVCIGTVVATSRTLYPNAVGGDIGCGVAALAFDCEAARLDDERAAAAVLARLCRAIPLTRHGRKRAPGLSPELTDRPLSSPALETLKSRDGVLQVGTLGRGNHFVELQSDPDDRLWLMLHSGSRGIGQAIRDHHLARCVAGRSGLRYLDATSPEGADYLADMAWAIDYAEWGRRTMIAAVCEVVKDVLGCDPDEGSYVSCNHNHVRRETHEGEALWVSTERARSRPPPANPVSSPARWELTASTSRAAAARRRCARARTAQGDA